MSRRQIEREQEARRELGHTQVSPATARALGSAFLLLVFGGALAQLGLGDLAAPWSALVARTPDACTLRAVERDFDLGAGLAARWRPAVQAGLVRVGAGNASAYVGRDGWLFQRASVDAALGGGFLDPRVQTHRVRDAAACDPVPQPDPLQAVLEWHEALARRSVRLVILPVPAKAEIQPEQLAGPRAADARVRNASYDGFVGALRARGVHVFEAHEILRATARSAHGPAYLATDTHWHPRAMEAVAEALAEQIRSELPLGSREVAFARESRQIRRRGDVAALLDLAGPLESVEVRPVRPSPTESRSAPVIVLGDSYTNIYGSSQAFAGAEDPDDVGWGADAGLAEQLAFYLGAPVQRIALNDDGAFASRLELARRARAAQRAGRDPFEGVSVVVWQFASRELSLGDWRHIDLDAMETPGSGAEDRLAGGRRVRARIIARAALPAPGGPYPDALVALRIGDLESLDGRPIPAPEGVVYLLAVRENRALPAVSALGPGDRVELRLWDFEDQSVAERYSTMRRTELDDPDALLLPAWFGELP
jgi:alginate O-acetyltransferase complex protein AlgJ